MSEIVPYLKCWYISTGSFTFKIRVKAFVWPVYSTHKLYSDREENLRQQHTGANMILTKITEYLPLGT